MSSICDDLRAAILQAAMQGRLTGTADEDWNESKIEDVCELSTGNSIPESIKKSKYMKVSEGRNYIGTKDLGFDHSFNYENGVKIPFDENNFRIANSGDILLCIEGGSAGRKIGILGEDVNYGNKLCRFSPNGDLNNRFLYFYIQSPLFQEQFSDSMTGIIGGVSIKKIKAISVRYPSIAEQKRIVEKIDELMARVADLEKSADALASLKKSFPSDVRDALLRAAMQGKLTEQLPEDGDAEELLEQIRAEKEKLISEGKIKKQKPLAPITDDEIPFSIPENWKWVRLNDILDVRDGTHDSPKYVKADVGVPLVTSKNLRNGSIDYSDVKYISIADSEAINQRSKVDINDILMAMIGTIGNPVKVVEEPHYSIKNMALLKHLPENMPSMDYILQVLNWAVSDMKEKSSGGVQKFVSLNFIREYPIPLPPLAEQKRIVERIDSLLSNINMVEKLIASE